MERQLKLPYEVVPLEVVPLQSRIWVSAADSACATLQALVSSGALTYYFTELRGLSLEWTGVAWLLFGLWNAANDPLFGWISDRTHSRLGRRLPYIRYGAPLFALSFILFWIELPGTRNNQWPLFVQLLLALFLFDTLYTAIATSVYIMPYEMAVSNRARSSIFLWKILFSVFWVAIPLVIERTIKPDIGDMHGLALFRAVMIALGIAMGAVVYLSSFFYKEKHFTQEQEQFPFLKSLKECFSNRAFVIFETISFTGIFAQTALMQGLWLYFDEVNNSPAPLYAALAVGVILGVLLWLDRRDAWGVKACVRWMTLLFAAGCFMVLVFGRSTPLAALGFFLFGTGFAGGMYLIPLMNGDVMDIDEHSTGLRREGMYAGVNSFITKPAISIAQWALLTILAAYGYDPNLARGTQSFRAETGILVAWALPTGCLLLLCFLALRWYPLSGPAWERIKRELSVLHAEKERRYLLQHSGNDKK